MKRLTILPSVFRNIINGYKKLTPTNEGTQGQILRNDGQGGCEWDNAATEQEIGEAVTDWLDEHATQSETYIEVEDSLTISGAAADSKTVGDNFTRLDTSVSDIKNCQASTDKIFDDWDVGHSYRLTINNFDIDTKWDSPSMRCVVIPCSPGDVFAYIGKGASLARPYGFVSSLSGTNNIIEYATATEYASRKIFSAPDGAAYLVVNTYSNVPYYIHKVVGRYNILSGMDLNDLITEGEYYCANSTIANSLSNFPSKLNPVGFCLSVKSLANEQSSNMRYIQTITMAVTSEVSSGMAYRIYIASGGFSDWKYINYPTRRLLEINDLVELEANTDLDDVMNPGSYVCKDQATCLTIKNNPLFVPSGFSLYVINSRLATNVDSYKRQFVFPNKTGTSPIYVRATNSAGWGEWQLLVTATEQNKPLISELSTFELKSPESIANGRRLRIGTNNVAHYWMQGSSYGNQYLQDYPIRIARWRSVLMNSDIDIMFLQECEDYIDENYTVSVFDTLYKPFFDSNTNIDPNPGSSGTDDASRRKILNRLGLDTNSELVQISSDVSSYTKHGYYNYKKVLIDDIGSILLINVHNFSGSGTAREDDRNKLLSSVSSFIISEDADYYIIAGDFNVISATDRSNLLSFCRSINGTPANGGIIGWFNTHSVEESEKPFDNIIVSGGINIKKIECDATLVPSRQVHTDHTPLVIEIEISTI